jgi:photosystem II stability/assembly factor-like uncharacterized protein
MRIRVLLPLALLLFAPSAHAAVGVGHSGWQWGNPQPQGNTLSAVDFAGGSGYAAGNFGTVLRTTDSGVNWQGLPTGTTATFTQVRAIDADSVVAGGGCALRRSDDAGATWRALPAVPAARCPAGVRSFSFVSELTGWVLRSDGSVGRTDDGGGSFAARAAVPGSAATGGTLVPADIVMISETTGYALAGSTLYRTTDGAATWTQAATAAASLNGLYAEGDTAYAVGDDNTVLKSTNTGASWTPIDVGELPAVDLARVDCVGANANRCLFATRDGDRLLRTGNGGGTFTVVSPSASRMRAVAFNTSQAAVAVGEAGATALSANGGSDWTPVGSVLPGTLTRLRAGGGAVYATGDDGALLRTTNLGEDWSAPNVPTSARITDVSFPDASTGFTLDATGAVRRTTDAGATWSPVTGRVSGRPSAILATDPNTVVLVGPGLVRSTDGGASFGRVGGLGSARFSDFDRTDASFVLFGRRALYAASAGVTDLRRLRRPGGKRAQIRDVDFVTQRRGYVLNKGGRLWRTLNGGKDWNELPAIGAGGAGLYAMAWADARNGYLALRRFGRERAAGYVLRTSDGGRSWRPQLVAPNALRGAGLLALDGATAFAIADGNQLLHTTSGGDQGVGAPVTVAAKPRRIRRTRRVTISGTAPPGVTVHLFLRRLSGGPWTARRLVVPSSGAFTGTIRVRRSTVVVAQYRGATGASDGSPALVIRKTP